jgi:dihydrofolate reductase
MTKVVLDISMSLDGFVTGPNAGVGNPLGDDGGRLHEWMGTTKTELDAEVFEEAYASSGAVVIGRRMFEVGVEPWGDPPPFGMPVFVLTHEAREPLPRQGGTTYFFAGNGIEDALDQAKVAAGDNNVGIWGGANIAQQYLNADLIDELQIHLVPVLLGQGSGLFDGLGDTRVKLRPTRTIETPSAVHLRFAVDK